MSTKAKILFAWILVPFAIAVMSYREWKWERAHKFLPPISSNEMEKYFKSKRQYEENHWIVQFVLTNLPK